MATLDRAFPANARTAVLGSLVLLLGVTLIIIARRIRLLGWKRALRLAPDQTRSDTSTIAFYERLMALLAQRGMERESHLTPLEFASSLESQQALRITRAYNRVRFGRQQLSAAELREVEQTLNELEDAEAK
jgi:hypothetical protein